MNHFTICDPMADPNSAMTQADGANSRRRDT